MCSLILAFSARKDFSGRQRHFLSNHLSILCCYFSVYNRLHVRFFTSYFIAVSVLARMRVYTVSYAPKNAAQFYFFSTHSCPQSSILPQNALRPDRNGK